MDLNQMPMMVALKERMSWLNKNQSVISQNIANADTPGYRAQTLEKQDFGSLVDKVSGPVSKQGETVGGPRGPRAPMGPQFGAPQDNTRAREDKDKTVSPTGNSVVLEEEMLKMANNQMEYGMVVNLYKKNVGLLRSAMGRRGI